MIQIAASPLSAPAGPTRPVLLAAQSGTSNFALALGSLLVPGAGPKALPGEAKIGEAAVADIALPKRQIAAEPGKELPEIDLDPADDEDAPEQQSETRDDAPASDDLPFAWLAVPAAPAPKAAPVAAAPIVPKAIVADKPVAEIELPEGLAPEAPLRSKPKAAPHPELRVEPGKPGSKREAALPVIDREVTLVEDQPVSAVTPRTTLRLQRQAPDVPRATPERTRAPGAPMVESVAPPMEATPVPVMAPFATAPVAMTAPKYRSAPTTARVTIPADRAASIAAPAPIDATATAVAAPGAIMTAPKLMRTMPQPAPAAVSPLAVARALGAPGAAPVAPQPAPVAVPELAVAPALGVPGAAPAAPQPAPVAVPALAVVPALNPLGAAPVAPQPALAAISELGARAYAPAAPQPLPDAVPLPAEPVPATVAQSIIGAPVTAAVTAPITPSVTAPAPQPVIVSIAAPAARDEAPVALRTARPDTPVVNVQPPRRPGFEAAQPLTVASLIAQLPAQTIAAQPFAFTPLRRILGDRDQPLVTNIAAPGAAILQQVTAAADAHQGTLDLRRQEWMGKMVEVIAAMQEAAPVKETRITLMPEALGKVDISVRHEGERVHVHFATETHAARQILTDAQPRLSELAEARGMRLGQTSFELGAGQSGANAQSGQRQNDAPRPQTPAAPASARNRNNQPAQTDDERVA